MSFIDETFARRLASVMASGSSSSSSASTLGSACDAPLKELKKSCDIRSSIFALIELATILGAPSTPTEKATKHALDTLKQYLPTLMALSATDAAVAAAWTPISLVIMHKLVPFTVHGEIMLIYMRVMAMHNGHTKYAKQIDAARIAVQMFCQNTTTAAAAAATAAPTSPVSLGMAGASSTTSEGPDTE